MLSKKILLFGLGLLTAYSCTPDRGTYNYTKLNEVEILGMDDEYEVNRFSKLPIVADLQFANGENKDEFEYLWYVYAIGNEKIDTICRERDLNYQWNNLPGVYSLVYKVIDKKNNVYYHKNAEVAVINTIDEGFMLLGTIGDSLNISMVNKIGILSKDLYKNYRGKYLDVKPEGIHHFIPGNAGGYVGREYITVTYDGGRASLFDPINFVDVQTEKDMFILSPDIYRIDGYIVGYSYNDILVNNDKLHLRRYEVPYNASVRGDEMDYEASTISITADKFLCVYDKLNRRFMTLNSDRTKVKTIEKARKGADFPRGDVQKDLIAGKCLSSGFSYAILRDDDGGLHVLDYILRDESGETKFQFAKMVPIDRAANIYDAKEIVFALENNFNNLLFYKENDSKLYHGYLNTINTELLEESVIIDMNSDGGNFTIERIYYANDKIAIAYKDKNSKETRNCGIAIFDITTTADDHVTLTEKFRHDGITENVAGVAYKFSTIIK